MLALRFTFRRPRGVGLSILFALEWLRGGPWWKSVLRLRWHCHTLPRALVGDHEADDASTTRPEGSGEQGGRS
jgi:hypothetical protein